jgi:hypothetical protein
MAQRSSGTVRGVKSRQTTTRTRRPADSEVQDANVIDMNGRAVEQPDDDDDSLDGVLSELGAMDQGSVNLFREPASGKGPMEYVDTISAEDAVSEVSILDHIKRTHGGGMYRVQVRDRNGWRRNKRIAIAKSHDDVSAPAPAAAAMQPSDMLAVLANQQREQFAQLLQIVERMRPAEGSREAMLKEISTIAQILKPAGGGDMSVAMGMLKQGIDIGERIGGGGASPTELMMESVRAFSKLADIQKGRPVPPKVARGAAPAIAGPGGAVPTPPAADPVPADPQLEAMRTLLRVVLAGAAKGSDPAIYADLITDQLTPEVLDELLGYADPVAVLVNMEPAAAAHAVWLAALVQELREPSEEIRDVHESAGGDGPSPTDPAHAVGANGHPQWDSGRRAHVGAHAVVGEQPRG